MSEIAYHKCHGRPMVPLHYYIQFKLQNPVGTGQYDVTRWNNSQHTNGSTSVFSSNTPRLPPRVDTPRELMLNERLHPKKISNTRKLFEAEVLEAPC